ncbi:hypothetical protein BDZ91DRAFT_684918 [Kalaharituber pfeilii]|nr:hypothetical protein BDZ91DRAFT_684918 [Kalaharituber pfeilii]
MNNTLHHLNYNNSQSSPNSTPGNNTHNYHQLVPHSPHEEEMLQMQTTSRSALPQISYGGSYYEGMFLNQYPAPSPPAPAPGPSLLNDHEYSSLSGFLETITEDPGSSLLYESKLSAALDYWDNDSQFPQTSGVSQHLQSYLQVASTLPSASSTLSTMTENLSPNLNNSTVQSMNIPSPPQSASSQPIIVNPFNEAHGLLPQSTGLQTPSEAAALNTLAWGSDPHFTNSRYHPPLTSVTNEQDIQRKVLALVTVQESATNTAANSPVEIKFERIGEDLVGSDAGSTLTSGHTQSPTLSANQSAGVKRPAEDDGDLQQQARKSRTRKESSTEPQPKGKRGGKRDQLTEAEKRANHIHSEQKRRNQIKHGFDTLTEMVPDLKGGGYSKSAVLQHAAVYVANLKVGNARLREILRELEERNSTGSSAPGGRSI